MVPEGHQEDSGSDVIFVASDEEEVINIVVERLTPDGYIINKISQYS